MISASVELYRLEMRKAAPAIRARIHEGIDDTGHVTTLKVLHRMIANVG